MTRKQVEFASVYQGEDGRDEALAIIREELYFIPTDQLIEIADRLNDGHYLTTDYT